MNKRKFLYLLSAIILVAGLITAGLVYRGAMNEADGDPTYEVVGGFIYQADNNKKYLHDLQLYGGKSAVLADEFMRWFGGLWHGKALAITTLVISILLSLIVFVIAKRPGVLADPESEK